MATQRSTKTTGPKKMGRPPTGITKDIIRASVDKTLAAKAKKLAFKKGDSFSAFVSRALESLILANQ